MFKRLKDKLLPLQLKPFFIYNCGVRASLRAPWLILRDTCSGDSIHQGLDRWVESPSIFYLHWELNLRPHRLKPCGLIVGDFGLSDQPSSRSWIIVSARQRKKVQIYPATFDCGLKLPSGWSFIRHQGQNWDLILMARVILDKKFNGCQSCSISDVILTLFPILIL